MDEKGDMIVKIVNTVSREKEVSIKMDNFNPSASAEVTILASDFIYSAPAYSVSIIRLHPQR